MAFAKGENPHHPRKGASIRVEPIRSKRHIANIKRIRLSAKFEVSTSC